jgi:glycosyltransferase involved in cell wall biosynthesis
MKGPLVSVIVPVYKAEKWLHRCVDSILAQTMENFELLLIDDGSPDRSGEICDEYAAKDSRVRVFHKENGGVSSARNLGLDNAQGEWISFVDADDLVEENYIAELLSSAKNDGSLVISGLKKEKNGIVINRVEFYNEIVDNRKRNK